MKDEIDDIDPPDLDGEEEDKDNSRLLRALDPNDKQTSAGFGAAAWRPVDGALAYTIRFENQPSATAPAQRIVITDTLDPNLDLSTLELTEITFAHQIIPVPIGLNHYESLRPFTAGTDSILADVQATLDIPNRTLTLTLGATDPATGWFPEDPLLGLLYPNDATRRGEGSISFLVRPQPGLPSGTRIENRARIVFDYNDPIDTPMVFNTLDAAAPSSAVAPLPAEAGSAILVQWSGHDDAGGSGVASYDVSVTVDSTNAFPWLVNTTATSAPFNGIPGHTYAFHSVARDNVGHEEAAPATPDTVVFIPTNAPVLADITSRVTDVGSLLLVSNTVTGTPVGAYRFSLAAPVPFGATINPTNGVLRWTPNCSQASRMHTITVMVADTGNPNLRDLRDFSVVTRECVVPQLGSLVLSAGDNGRVPINLISSVPLTNLSMTVETETNRLINLWLEPIVEEICASSLVVLTEGSPHAEGTTGYYLLTLGACPSQSLVGTQQVAWLHFSAAADQTSAFVSLQFDNGVGLQPDGREVRNFAPQAGRAAVVGEEPMLEANPAPNDLVQLLLYSTVGVTNYVQSTLALPATGPWTQFEQIVSSNLVHSLAPIPAMDRARFFRAVRP